MDRRDLRLDSESGRKPCGGEKSDADARDACGPSQKVEKSAEHDGADEAAEEVGSEIQAARAAAIGRGAAADETGRDGLRWERADPDKREPGKDDFEVAGQQRESANSGQGQSRPDRRARSQPADEATGERRRQDRRREDEVNEADLHHAEAERRAGQDEVDVGERADEGEEYAEADAERRAQGGHAEVTTPDRKRMVAHHIRPRRAWRALDDDRGEGRAEKVERGEGEEISRDAKMVDQRGGAQPPDEVARDIAGDIGGEVAGYVLS